jgi:hypothetical protein
MDVNLKKEGRKENSESKKTWKKGRKGIGNEGRWK